MVLCGTFLRESGIGVSTLRWHFFFLGAGFMLFEAQIISRRMALLFGTTWIVNSLVIAELMIFIVAANCPSAEWQPRIPPAVGYVGIFATGLLAYVLPLESFFFASVWLEAGERDHCALSTGVFRWDCIYSEFREQQFHGEALGSNLLGALAGGLLESFSMWTGIHSLVILACALYGASWIALEYPDTARHIKGASGKESSVKSKRSK